MFDLQYINFEIFFIINLTLLSYILITIFIYGQVDILNDMASRFGSDDLFMCACGQIFYNKRGLGSHMTNTSDGNDHFPTGIY